jgi:hypothetical protein
MMCFGFMQLRVSCQVGGSNVRLNQQCHVISSPPE